jgi:putative hydrolase of the HAD superfamily
VFFDVGGTLLRPDPSVGAVYARVGQHYGYEASVADWEQAFRNAWNSARSAGGSGLMTAEKEWWRSLVFQTLESLKLQQNERTRDAYFEELYAAFARADAWKLYPEALGTLERVRAHRLHVGVISNWDSRLRPLLKALRVDDRFDSITVSCEVRAEKPAPDIFRAALRAARTDPDETWHVGDSYVEDVRGAEAVGMQAVLVARMPGERKANCRAVPDLNGVADLLDGAR